MEEKTFTIELTAKDLFMLGAEIIEVERELTGIEIEKEFRIPCVSELFEKIYKLIIEGEHYE